jgi:hypothetical protein
MSRVQVVASIDGDQGFLQVHKLDLSGYGIPDSCPVILEAMTRRDGKIRIELGVTPQPELTRKLKVDPIFFSSARIRLNILDASGTGRIVASVEDVDIDIPETSGLRAFSVAGENCPIPEVLKNKWERLFGSIYSDPQDLKTTEPDAWADEVAEALSGRYSLINSYRNSWGEEE